MFRSKERFVANIPATHITESQLRRLLEILYSKLVLANHEIVRSCIRSNVRESNNLLAVNEYRNKGYLISYQIGLSEHVYAQLVRPTDGAWEEVAYTTFSTTHSPP